MWNPVFEFCATFQEGHYYGLDLNVPPQKKAPEGLVPCGWCYWKMVESSGGESL